MWGSATTLMPAAATSSATSRWRCVGLQPRLTQWLAVTRAGSPVATTRSARSSSASIAGFERLVGVQVDRQSGLGRDRRGGRRWPRPGRSRGAGSRRRRRRRRRSPRGAAPAGRRPSGADRRPRAQRDDLDVDQVGAAARAPRSAPRPRCRPLASVRSAWVRMAVKPLAASSRAARSARSIVSARVIEPRARSIATIAPIRSPVGLATRSARKALSRWACGSANAGKQRGSRRRPGTARRVGEHGSHEGRTA